MTRVILASSAGSWYFSVWLVIRLHGMRVCVTPAAALLSEELSLAVPALEPEGHVASVNLYVQHSIISRARHTTRIL
jgi:hypothetical protein